MSAFCSHEAATRAHDIADFGRWFESSLGPVANIKGKVTLFQPGQSGSSLRSATADSLTAESLPWHPRRWRSYLFGAT